MRDNGTGFYHFAMDRAVGHKDYFAALEPLAGERLAVYVDEAAASLKRQAEIEASDTMSFDDYLEKYFSEQGCSDCS
jgi:glutamate--cysteine ligase